VRAWQDSGIRDSKAISSAKTIAELAKLVRETPGCLTSVISIGNEAYNRLYQQMNSVNLILAWGHARAIENLLQQSERMIPPPLSAISDQFASNKAVVASALMKLGQTVALVQRHRAESDLAVAAASILARHEFLMRMGRLEQQLGVRLPLGASSAVDLTAKHLVKHHGERSLGRVAKLHFRNAARAMGLPEPARPSFRRAERGVDSDRSCSSGS